MTQYRVNKAKKEKTTTSGGINIIPPEVVVFF